jgi:hypothetical protein
VAEKLIPIAYDFGTRRVPLKTNYFEASNRDNVDLVDVKENPIERLTETGCRPLTARYTSATSWSSPPGSTPAPAP